MVDKLQINPIMFQKPYKVFEAWWVQCEHKGDCKKVFVNGGGKINEPNSKRTKQQVK